MTQSYLVSVQASLSQLSAVWLACSSLPLACSSLPLASSSLPLASSSLPGASTTRLVVLLALSSLPEPPPVSFLMKPEAAESLGASARSFDLDLGTFRLGHFAPRVFEDVLSGRLLGYISSGINYFSMTFYGHFIRITVGRHSVRRNCWGDILPGRH